jgi:hypothetical protein
VISEYAVASAAPVVGARVNGMFMGVGNGGWSGAIVYPALANALSHNYAAASTNTGHDGGDAKLAILKS